MIEESTNQLFRFLRASFRAVGEAHRTNPRRHTATPARLSWTEGARCRTVRSRMLDISRAGAALIAAAPPPLKAHARLRLVGPEPTPWVEADVLDVEPAPRGRYRVRLRFTDPCPTYFLRVAVLGPVAPDEEGAAPGTPPAEPLDQALRPSAS